MLRRLDFILFSNGRKSSDWNLGLQLWPWTCLESYPVYLEVEDFGNKRFSIFCRKRGKVVEIIEKSRRSIQKTNMATQICDRTISGRNFDYARALEIIQDEEYLEPEDFDEMRFYRKHGKIVEAIEKMEESYSSYSLTDEIPHRL